MAIMHRCETTVIYTVSKGVVSAAALLNMTPKGYRVRGRGFETARVQWDYVVFLDKQRSGYATDEDAPFYQERSFTDKEDATTFAHEQTLCMETYYRDKLTTIENLKLKLGRLI